MTFRPGLTRFVLGLSSVALTTPAFAAGPTDSLRIEIYRFGPFGPVTVYRYQEHPAHVALFVSGDGGWNLGVTQMAKELATMDALVVGIDIRRYLKSVEGSRQPCAYPAGDLEQLSQWIQHKLGYSSYTPPLLVGYSSGATLVYVALAQAPPTTFAGGLSLGFCRLIRTARLFCKGDGPAATFDRPARSVRVAPADSLRTPWTVLQGQVDSSCTAADAVSFVRRARGSRIVLLPEVGHGFGVEAHWREPFRAAFETLARNAAAPPPVAVPGIRDLPLVELRSRPGSRDLAVVVSGDGGWASIDRQIGESLSAAGIPVVGLNSLHYFWKARTPEQASADLARILRHYLGAWHTSDVVLVGYSRGADVLPFMTAGLPDDLRSRVRLVALVGLSRRAGFEFHFADLFRGGSRTDRPTVPEIQRLQGMRVLCVYGADEQDSACRDLPRGLAVTVELPGGHHFGGAYREVAGRILQMIRTH
ncbi:MAG TPA: AcvB/VirJ family lysyl-phosphatidylglycerol hydrolase [Gemmatimonadales bacterium]